MSQIVWTINQWNGEQDDDYIGPAGCCTTSIGIDSRRKPSFIQLSPAMTDTGWVFDAPICFHKNLEDFGLSGILICLTNGKVFISGVLKYQFNTGTPAYDKILGCGYIGDVSGTPYFYLISSVITGTGQIHRVTTDFLTYNTSYIPYTTDGALTLDKIPVINEPSRFVFGCRNKVYRIDNQQIITQYLTINKYSEIVAITEFQGTYKIYANTGITCVQHFWDGVTRNEEFMSAVKWNNQPVLGVRSDGAFDYATVGFNENYSDLYLVTGPQRQEVRVNREGTSTGRTFNTHLSIRGEVVYISGSKLGVKGIYTYGNFFPGFNKSLIMEYVASIAGTDNFLSHTHSSATSYFACSNNKVYSISHNDVPSTYINNGYLITKKWTGNGIHTKKSIGYMYAGYILPSSSYSIKIYARKDNGSFRLLKTITDNTQRGVMITASEFSAVDLGDLYELQLKFELIGPANPTDTPLLGEVFVFCNDNYNK